MAIVRVLSKQFDYLAAVGAMKAMYGLEHRAGESMPPLVVRCIAVDGTVLGGLKTIKLGPITIYRGKATSWPLQVWDQHRCEWRFGDNCL